VKGGRLIPFKVPLLRSSRKVPTARCIFGDGEATHVVIPGRFVCQMLPAMALKVCEGCIPRLEGR
jgi:hypothetical protein